MANTPKKGYSRKGTHGETLRKQSIHQLYRRVLRKIFRDPRKFQAAYAVSVLFCIAVAGILVVASYLGYLVALAPSMPSLEEIENPDLDRATVAYTVDGMELARFGRQNRSWIRYEDISPHVISALVSTEDARFFHHWGVDVLRTASALTQSIIGALPLGFLNSSFQRQGGSTITQQLARNLFNIQIGFAVTVERKLKEMATAAQLERRYSKQEIIEMYLNTVPFRHNAYGIEAASRTYFSKSAADLDVLESATMVGMLQANTRYDPVRNPDLSRQRRNVVLRQMIRRDTLSTDRYQEIYDTYGDSLTTTRLRTGAVTDSFAPYFAEHIRIWLAGWGDTSGVDVFGEGLRVYTTLDSRLQRMAQEAVDTQMKGLQAVAECEWSSASSPRFELGGDLDAYQNHPCHTEPSNRWAYFWERRSAYLTAFVKETPRYAALLEESVPEDVALEMLLEDEAFVDSLKTDKGRLEVGMVSLDPLSGQVRAWVGGSDLRIDRYDHVATAKRQPGSTFKPFLYATAIHSGHHPTDSLKDERFVYRSPDTGAIWSPENSGGSTTGRTMTLREGLARSLNTISGQLILQVPAIQVVTFAEKMGIKSPLDPVPSLALGTSEVSVLELTSGFNTLANLGIYNEPTGILRIEDRNGKVLYEHQPVPNEALSVLTSSVVLDMMRGVVNEPYGTGIRIRNQYGLTGYDFAGKTGTTQEGADGWFVLLHPKLVTGAWVGFNDRRMTFRSSFWGQGAHNALFVVGDFTRRIANDPESILSQRDRFPLPEALGYQPRAPSTLDENRTEW